MFSLQNAGLSGHVFKNAAQNGIKPRFLKTGLKGARPSRVLHAGPQRKRWAAFFCLFSAFFFGRYQAAFLKNAASEPQNLKFLKIPFVNSLSPLSSFFLLKSLRYRTSASNQGFSHSDQCCSSSIKLQVHFFHPFLLFRLSYFLFILTEKLLLRSMESKFQNFISPPSSPI